MRFKPKSTALIIVCVLLLALMLSSNVNSWTGNLEALSWYPDATKPYSYLIDRNSTHYFMFNGSTGKCDYSSTNASKVVNFAIGNTSDGKIFIKDELSLTAPIIINKNSITLSGVSQKWTSVLTNAMSGDNYLIKVQGNARIEYTKIENLMLRSSSRSTTKDGIYIKGCRVLTLSNLYLRNLHDNIVFDSSDADFANRGDVNLEDINIEEMTGDGIKGTGTAVTPEFDGYRIRIYSSTRAKAGLNGFKFDRLRGTFFNVEMATLNQSGWDIADPANLEIDSPWVEGALNYGIYLHSTGTDGYLGCWNHVKGGTIHANYKHGIYWNNINCSTIVSVTISSNSREGAGTYDGIRLTNCFNDTVALNPVGDMQNPQYQNYAVKEDGTSDGNQINSNNVQWNLNTISTVGLNTLVYGNTGYISPSEYPLAKIIVYGDGSTYSVWSRVLGNIFYSGTNASLVVNTAFTHLTNARTNVETVALVGDFQLSTYIKVPSYTRLDLSNAHVTVPDNYSPNLVTYYSEDFVTIMRNDDLTNGNQYIEIDGGWIKGTSITTNDTSNNWALLMFGKVAHLTIHDTHVEESAVGLNTSYTGNPRAFNIYINECWDVWLDNVKGIRAGYETLAVRGKNHDIHIVNCYFEGGVTHVAQVTPDWINTGIVRNIEFMFTTFNNTIGEDSFTVHGSPTLAGGISFFHCAFISTTSVSGETRCMKLIQNVDGVIIDSCLFRNTMTASGSNMLTLGTSAYSSTTIKNVYLRNNNMSSEYVGIKNVGQPLDTLVLQNNRIQSAGNQRSVDIEVSLVNGLIENNRLRSSTGTVFYLNAVSNTTFLGNFLVGNNGFYEAGTCSINTYAYNNVDGTTTPFTITATDDTFFANRGFVTENWISHASTVNGHTIAHGLAGTPDYVLIIANLDQKDINVGYSADATNITVNLHWDNGTAVDANHSPVNVDILCKYVP